MFLLALMDPEGTKRRGSRRLKRRIYRSKVINNKFLRIAMHPYYNNYRDLTLSGTVMDMTN